MPSKSKKQHNAMEAACHGKSNLGISREVGCEYVRADRKRSAKRAGSAKPRARGRSRKR